MIVQATHQTKREFCIAVFNRTLDSNSICPANHDVDYDRGWFYMDGACEQRPELTAEAVEIMRSGSHYVGYWALGNTYVLVPDLSFEETDEHEFTNI